jgi:hypothetical protein
MQKKCVASMRSMCITGIAAFSAARQAYDIPLSAAFAQSDTE